MSTSWLVERYPKHSPLGRSFIEPKGPKQVRPPCIIPNCERPSRTIRATEYVGDKLVGYTTERPTIALVGDHRIVLANARGYDLHEEDKDDAEFICRAVNAHDDLVAALTESEAVIDALDRSGYSQGDVLATIRAALSKASSPYRRS